MKKLRLSASLLITLGLVPRALAQNSESSAAQRDQLHTGQAPSYERLAYANSYRAWKISLVPVIASQALDAYSSYGLHEANPLLAGASQRFGGQSTLIKLGILSALIGAEYLFIRKHPGSAKLLWKLNIVDGAVTGAVAAHNFSFR